MIECPFCGYQNPDTAEFCNNCRIDLTMASKIYQHRQLAKEPIAETIPKSKTDAGTYLSGLRASFMWWWVIALVANFILVIILSYPVDNILTWLVETSGDWFASGCFEDLGFWGCAFFYLFLGWWIMLLALIFYTVLWLLFTLWPYIAPIGSLYIAYRLLKALRLSNNPLLSHLRWSDYLGAIASFPLTYLLFTFVLQEPFSPFGPAEIIKSIMPSPLENIWFIALGVAGWIITWLVLFMFSWRINLSN